MYKISLWAKDHKWSSRMIIVLLHIIITYCAFVAGTLMADTGWLLPGILWPLVCMLFLSLVLLYPDIRTSQKRHQDYRVRKIMDSLLALCTFLMVFYLSNQVPSKGTGLSSMASAFYGNLSAPKDSMGSVVGYKSLKEFSASMKDENGKTLKWKERKKLMKAQIKAIKKDSGLSDSDKGLLIALTVVVAIAAIFGVAAIACSLSCNGAEAAAIVVGIGGSALVIFLTVLAIRNINKKHKRAEPVSPPAGSIPGPF